ncbi:MAG: T9SS type A sorting domain-containing protein [Bacteroidetes bacterium]|nr:T9SS type A sorting domain-containing protein [Bacteroidota bacterium]
MGTNTIDVSNLAKGMYLVSVITETGKQTQKVVVE